MTVSPERRAEIVAALAKVMGLTEKDKVKYKQKPKPTLVVNEAEVIRDANVQVSPADPNYRSSDDGVVRVQRKDFVTINMAAWEEQQAWKQEARRERRRLDPARLGLYGPIDEDD